MFMNLYQFKFKLLLRPSSGDKEVWVYIVWTQPHWPEMTCRPVENSKTIVRQVCLTQHDFMLVASHATQVRVVGRQDSSPGYKLFLNHVGFNMWWHHRLLLRELLDDIFIWFFCL